MVRSFSSNLRGKVRNFSLPKNRPLVPLYEAIVNSINAIDERVKTKGDFSGNIKIEVLKDNVWTGFSDDFIRGFRIQDNGIGFDESNMKSFMEADSEYKMDIGGKGVGRFSWLKAFSTVRIASTFKDDTNKFVTRRFDFDIEHPEVEDTLELAEEGEYKTVVELLDYKEDYKKELPKTIDTISTRIIQHCFVYLLSETCPEIDIFDSEKQISLNKMFKKQFSTDTTKTSFKVGQQEFSLLNFKINDRAFPYRNRLYLCANERLVDSKALDKFIVNLDQSIFEEEGYWYLGVLTSEYFDENVDMNRLSFSIPKESRTLFPDSPGLDDIIKVAADAVRDYLKNYLDNVETRKQQRIQSYTRDIAPQYRHLEFYVPDEIATLKPGLSDDELDDALYGIKRAFENKTKDECNGLLKKLKSGEITAEEYQNQFQSTIGKVSDVNRATLAEYVVHRRIILNLFNQGLEIRPDGKFNLEKYMHQIIYPMRATSDELPYENSNLWLIDEKLSFCQFISSDMPFNNSNNEERSDILVLDNPVVVAENKNTGLAYDSIAIFELKKPMRNDYTMESNPVTQLLNYAKKIIDGNAKDCKHRPIRVTDTTQFYLYALCDITETLEKVLDFLSFTRTPDGLGAYKYNENLHAYIEVLSFDKIRNDAEKRNKVLFEKLGI